VNAYVIFKRMRWAWAVLLLSACARDSRGTQPPHDGEPRVAATATTTPSEAPEPPAEAPPEPVPTSATAEPPSTEPEPPPTQPGLGPPTDAEFHAWDRPDPEGEAKLDAWDREHIDRMLRTYDELRCFHQTLLAAGERQLGNPNEKRWTAFERDWVTTLDAWQKRYFAEDPRALEKSRFFAYVLEAHEILSRTYVEAYDTRDRAKVDEVDRHWLAVEAKVRKRVEKLGGQLAASPTRCDPPAKR
jgi:hypothetical protein